MSCRVGKAIGRTGACVEVVVSGNGAGGLNRGLCGGLGRKSGRKSGRMFGRMFGRRVITYGEREASQSEGESAISESSAV